MRTIFIALLLMFDLAVFSQNTVYNFGAIPSEGSTISLSPTSDFPAIVYAGTASAVNLGANSYTLSYSSAPPTGTGFFLYLDATNLTATASHVTLFGYQPLVTVPNLGFYKLRFDWKGSTVTVTCYADAANSTVVINRTTFNAAAYFNDTLTSGLYTKLENTIFWNPNTATPAGYAVTFNPSDSTLKVGCPACAWNILGNSGTGGGLSFVGTIDTADLRFRVNNIAAGIIDYNNGNTALGATSLLKNTSGSDNTAIGAGAMVNNTTGNNSAFGAFAAGGVTTGSGNTAVGRSAMASNPTTGSNNTAIGGNATTAGATTAGATALGYNTSAGSNGVAIGFGATAGANQLAISGVENIYLSGMNNHLGYALIDTSGTGNFVPQPVPQTTPLIDSVTGTSSQTFTLSNNQTNILTASTTVAGATLAFPSAQAGTIYVIWKVSTTTTTVSGTNTGTTVVPSTVAAGVSRKFVNIGGNWY